MSASVSARPCGPGSLGRWLSSAWVLARRLGVEWWMASGLVFLLSAWAMGHWPRLTVALVAWGMVVGRGLWGVAGVLMVAPAPSPAQQWRGWLSSGVGWLAWMAAGVSVACVVSHYVVAPDGAARASNPDFLAQPVFFWAAWLARPWGPLGFTRALRRRGCGPLVAFRLQSQAFWKNSQALLGLGALWIMALALLIWLPWLGLASVFAWPLVLRCAFADIFEGGLKVAQSSPVQVPAPVVSRWSG